MIKMTYTSERVLKDLCKARDSEGNSTILVKLADGEPAWNPASTSRNIYGPAILRYRRWADGGVDVIVNTLD